MVKAREGRVELRMSHEEKESFVFWCEVNNKRMSDVLRELIQPYLEEGRKMLIEAELKKQAREHE